MSSPTAAVLGEIGLPAPIRELAAETWDAIVVGAGHNGLACAAYLARAGKRVLVLESRAARRRRLHHRGAVSRRPHVSVRLSRRPACIRWSSKSWTCPGAAITWTPAVNGLFVPFLDGIQHPALGRRRALRRRGPRALSRRCRRLARHERRDPPPARCASSRGRTATSGSAKPPTREQIEDRLGNDAEARSLLFDWSMAEFVERYLNDERLQIAYLGQGVIGTNASPFDPGTASIRFHHASGRLGGMPGMWGYVRGGMGMVSFYFCDAAREAGATVVSGVPVAQIVPGEGVAARRRRANRRAHRRLERRSAPDSPPARRRSRSGLARSSGARSHGRLHRQAQRPPARAAQLHRAPRHRPAPSLRPDQCSADQGRMEGRLCRRAPRRVAGAPLVRALLPKRA